MPTYIAALDVGTTGGRTIIFDLDGKEIARHYEEWNSIYPSPVMVEQQAGAWWNAMKGTTSGALKKGKINPRDIVGVACTNQRETIVPVDKDGKPLANALVWQDRRTIEECNIIREKVGQDLIYKKTGLTIDPYFSASKILWFKRHQPDIYAKTYKFLLVHDFILHKLTGQFITDYTNASRTMLFDINSLKWSEEIASAIELDLDKMPEAVPPGKAIGKITMKDTGGFTTDTTAVAGAGDQQAAALGVGVVDKGKIKCTTGTGSFILNHLDHPQLDSKKRVLCSCHADGKWVQEASIFTSGAVYRWVRDTIGKPECEIAQEREVDPYNIMNDLAKSSPVGANGLILIPHFIGAGAPYWNPLARGILFGLSLGHTRSDLYRAVMEGVAFEVRINLEVFREQGSTPQELRVTGGGSRSDIWNQIMADVCGIPIKRGELEESTAIGAAILAAYGTGQFTDIKTAANKIAIMSKVWEPNAPTRQKYDDLYKLSRKLITTLAEANIYVELEKIRGNS